VPTRAATKTQDRTPRGGGPVRAVRRKPRQRSHAETVYEALKKDILSGSLPPGSILREEELARRHQVSRTPVREALNRLETEGLAARHAGAGLLVSELGPDEIIDLYVLREALEGLAASLAASRRTEIDLARLQMLNDLAQQAVRDADLTRASRVNAEFHFVIWRIAGNRPLLRAISGVHESVQRFPQNTLAYPGRLEESVGEHARLLDAIRERDHERAEQIAVEHVRRVRNIRIALSLDPEQLLAGSNAALD
jgi:DNA-binding GntR family transcriptional regulator